jgi:hypothetical protein
MDLLWLAHPSLQDRGFGSADIQRKKRIHASDVHQIFQSKTGWKSGSFVDQIRANCKIYPNDIAATFEAASFSISRDKRVEDVDKL